MPQQGSTPGFGHVDRTPAPEFFIGYLERMSSLPFIQALKAQSIDWLGVVPGDHCLDVGCGLGDEVREIAQRVAPGGSVVGVDSSLIMIYEAIRRSADLGLAVEFCATDGKALPYGDGSFDRVRGERYLQVVDDPDRALAEMVRVCRPGGIVVAGEADFGTIAVDASDRRITEAILRTGADTVRTGWMGRQLRRRFLDAGLVDVEVEASCITLDDVETAIDAFRLADMVDRAISAGAITAMEGQAWLREVRERGRHGRFLATMSGFQARGRHP